MLQYIREYEVRSQRCRVSLACTQPLTQAALIALEEEESTWKSIGSKPLLAAELCVVWRAAACAWSGARVG
jgi:hypothetical protein